MLGALYINIEVVFNLKALHNIHVNRKHSNPRSPIFMDTAMPRVYLRAFLKK